MQSMVYFEDDFLVDTLNGDYWAESVGNGGVTLTLAAAANGTATTAVNATDNDVAEIYGPALYYARQACVFECRLKVNAITTVSFAAGFANAASATNDKIVFDATTDTLTAGTNITDAAVFLFDTDATTDRWFAAAINASGTPQGGVMATGIVPAADTYEVLKVAFNAAGDAGFYRNGVCVYSIPLAVAPTVALRPYFALKGCATTARLLTVDYVKVWQNRLETSTVVW
jgi:hypothetical protein